MPPGVTISPMTEADVDGIYLAFASWNKTRAQYERYFEENRAETRITFVAHRGTEVVGYANVLWQSDYLPFSETGIPETSDLNVVTSEQGQGIGTALIRACENAMRNAGKPTAGIGVGLTPDYAAAQRLYPRMGYVHDSRPPISTRWGNERYFTKPLQPIFEGELSMSSEQTETLIPQTERPKEGEPAPDFSLATHAGDAPVRLSDFKGKQPVVLYFYPKDDTPGCTTESCNFRDLSADFAEAGAVILGVSLDDVASHKQFAEKFKLPFPLLADTDARVSTAYGVYKEKNLYGRKSLGIERTTFIIGRDGNIAKVYPRVKVDQHGEEVLAFVREHAG